MSDHIQIPASLWEAVVELCFAEMPARYRGGEVAVVEWRLRGRANGRWQVVLGQERCEVRRNGRLHPDLRLEISDLDFVAVCLGREDPRRLTLRRRLRPRGSLLLAARLGRLFETPGT